MKLEKTSDFKSTQHELLDIKAESSVEDSTKSPEECKDALGLSLNNTYHTADCAMADSEETTNMDQVIGTDRGTDKENDGERAKHSNFDMIKQATEDPKSAKTSNFDVHQVIDTDQDLDQQDDGERGKSSNFDTITQASKDQKSEKKSDLDVDQVIGTGRETDKENDGERGKGSNFDTKIQASKDPKSIETSDFEADQVIDTNRDTDKEDEGERGKGCNFDMITQASEDPKFEKTSDFDADQVIDTDRDTNKEHDAERGKGSNFEKLHVSENPKSEKTSDLKSIQHELPDTKAESLAGSSDDRSSQESKYGLGSRLKHTEDNGHVMHTEKSTDVDCIGAEPEKDAEKKKGDLLEPRSCHEYTMSVAKIVDTKDEETAMDLIGHNSSCSPPEESLVIELPKSSMQVSEAEDRCTVLKEESLIREEHLGTETVVEDNIPTQFKISNEVQKEFNTIGSHSEHNAEETEVSPESVAKNKNQNEAPGEYCEDSDGEYLEISEQGMAILTLSVGDCKHKNEEMGEAMDISTNNGHEGERREPEESLFEPVLGFQPQIHQKETSITFQTAESTDESVLALRQETKTTTENSKKNPSDSPHYIQTAPATLAETKPSTNPIDERSVPTLPFSTLGEEDQESPGRTSNESNSDNSIAHIEMRKSPSFNIDIQIEGRAGETEKIPLLYQIKTIEDLPNLQEISFPNPMEKRVVKLGRSDSEKSKSSFPGFVKEKEQSEMEFKAIDQNNLAAAKKAVKDLPPPSPIRKGKRRTKSLIFGTCICCATAIN